MYAWLYCITALAMPTPSIPVASEATNVEIAHRVETLCPICATVDLPEYFQQEMHVHHSKNNFVGPSDDALRLGSLTDVYS